MLRSLFGRALTFVVLGAVVVAIWRANNGDVSQLANSVVQVLQHGADVVTSLWNGFVGLLKTDGSAPQ